MSRDKRVMRPRRRGMSDRTSGGVFCPKCGKRPCAVVDSRTPLHRQWITRRRECLNRRCQHRFTTMETYAARLEMPAKVKAIVAGAITNLQAVLRSAP